MDSQKRSGHGRVIYCYFELCEKIWGGSPATDQIDTGVETVELNEQPDEDVQQEESVRDESENGGSSVNDQTATQQPIHADTQPQIAVQIGRKRCEQLSSTLNNYKQQKINK